MGGGLEQGAHGHRHQIRGGIYRRDQCGNQNADQCPVVLFLVEHNKADEADACVAACFGELDQEGFKVEVV